MNSNTFSELVTIRQVFLLFLWQKSSARFSIYCIQAVLLLRSNPTWLPCIHSRWLIHTLYNKISTLNLIFKVWTLFHSIICLFKEPNLPACQHKTRNFKPINGCFFFMNSSMQNSLKIAKYSIFNTTVTLTFH